MREQQFEHEIEKQSKGEQYIAVSSDTILADTKVQLVPLTASEN